MKDASSEAIISFRDVSKRFGRIAALDGVNLDIRRGRIVGLLGANGAGKSTLLRHIIGLYLPDRGSCTTFGCEAGKLRPEELARLGYVHQEGELLAWMKVSQLIRYVSAYYTTWNTALEERYIAEFDLDRVDKVGTLSPGQRQKLAILLAIGFEPELLILDEPASALDPLARGRFLDWLLELIQDEGRTIVISSHILSDVEKVMDHAVIMDRGRIVCDKSFDDLREEFLRFKLTSLNGPLPAELGFANMLHCDRNDTQAMVTLRQTPLETVQTRARELNCDVEMRALSLDELYKLVVAGKKGGGL